VITQCSIRHLYTAEGPDAAAKMAWIDTAKSFERRRCNHHTLDEPLSTLECLKSVVDPKDSSTNKNRYVIASQDQKVRSAMRRITGVPLIYVNRSVMIMEPMATQTEEFREAEEMGKVRAGLKGRRGAAPEQALKRKREDEDDDDDEAEAKEDAPAQDTDAAPKKRVKKGPKGPNPLSVKKSKKQTTKEEAEKQAIRKAAKTDPQAVEKALDANVAVEMTENDASEAAGKKRRRRKHKTAGDSAADQPDADDAPAVAMEVDA
jgi:U3 small nucleolar RNA-associated protein 23